MGPYDYKGSWALLGRGSPWYPWGSGNPLKGYIRRINIIIHPYNLYSLPFKGNLEKCPLAIHIDLQKNAMDKPLYEGRCFRFEVDKKQILFSSEKIRNSGNCIYDYAPSFF